MFRLLSCSLLCLAAAPAEDAPAPAPAPKVDHWFAFETDPHGWRAAGEGTVEIENGSTYRESKGALKLSWRPGDAMNGWVERDLDLTLTPDTWLTLVYRHEGEPCGGFAVRFITSEGETFTCSGFSAPGSGWRRIIIRVCFDWWARQFCFVGPERRVLPSGTRVTKLRIGTWPLKGTGKPEGAEDAKRELYLDDIVLFESFGVRQTRSLFNPRGVVRSQRPCPVAFEFPRNLKHPYLITTRDALEKRAAAYRDDVEDGPVRAGFDKLYGGPVRLWIAQTIGKLKAPEPVEAPEEAEKAFDEIEADDGPDEILNPEPPPPEELSEEDWEVFFEMELVPHAADPRYLEEKANICARCARALPFDPLRPQWHQCPRCRHRYQGPAYDNVWSIQMQRRDLGLARSAAWAYRISGEDRWGRVARKIVLCYCKALESDRRFQSSTNGASAFLIGASALIPLVDLLADTPILSRQEQERMRDNFVTRAIRSASLFDPTPPSPIKEPEQGWFHYRPRWVGNLVGHALKEMMWIGVASQNEDYIRRVFDSYDEAIYNGFNSEGVWWEKSIDYQIFFRKGLVMLGGIAQKIGVNLYTHVAANGKSLRGSYDAELNIVMPNNQLPSLNDGGRVGFCGAEAYKFYGDEKYNRRGENATPLRSVNMPVTGWGVLRSDAEEARDQTYLMLDHGVGSGAHQHPDTMQIILYARRKYVSPDLGVASYHAAGYWTWYKNPRSHNTMTPLPTKGRTLYFEHAPRLKVIDVETPQDRPLRHRRTVALVRNYVVDLFRADSDEEKAFTWRHHNIGKQETRRAINPDGSRWNQAYWDLEDNQALRLSTLCREGTSFVSQTGLGYRPTDKLFYVAAQRKSRRFLVSSVIEPFIDITADSRKVEVEDEAGRMKIRGGGAVTDMDEKWPGGDDPFEERMEEEEDAKRGPNAPKPLPYEITGQKTTRILPLAAQEGQAAFCVESEGGSRDYYLAAYDAEQTWKTDALCFRGEVGMVFTEEGKPTDVLILGGRKLETPGWCVEMNVPASVHIYTAAGGLRVHTGVDTEARLIVRVAGVRPTAVVKMEEGRPGESVKAEIDGEEAAFAIREETDYLIRAARQSE